jgi:hypothetical protein
LPSRDELAAAWDGVLESLPKRVKARFSGGRFADSTATHAVLAFPNDVHRTRCEELRGEVEAALGGRFGRPVALRLVADDAVGTGGPVEAPVGRPAAPARGGPAEPDATPDEIIDPDELTDAPAGGGVLDRLTSAFPGAELVEES